MGWEMGPRSPVAEAADPDPVVAGPNEEDPPLPGGSAGRRPRPAWAAAPGDMPVGGQLGGSPVGSDVALPGSAPRQFEQATQLLAADKHRAAIPLLRACCRLEPANLVFRDALRDV